MHEKVRPDSALTQSPSMSIRNSRSVSSARRSLAPIAFASAARASPSIVTGTSGGSGWPPLEWVVASGMASHGARLWDRLAPRPQLVRTRVVAEPEVAGLVVGLHERAVGGGK